VTAKPTGRCTSSCSAGSAGTARPRPTWPDASPKDAAAKPSSAASSATSPAKCSSSCPHPRPPSPSSRLHELGLAIYRSINALAESVIGLFKTEVIRRRGPWRNLDDVEFAVLEWVHWFNTTRLFEPIGHVPPAEFEDNYYAALGQLELPGVNQFSLRRTRSGSCCCLGRLWSVAETWEGL